MPDTAITVLIPTYRRPAMLRAALESVQAQSAVGSIREVVVSENGEDAASRKVCAEFPGLPIRHVNRVPQMPPLSHFLRIAEEAKTGLVGFLGDDDMWGRYHLEEALRNFDRFEGIVASFGAAVTITHGERRVVGGYGTTLEWAQAGEEAPFTEVTLWDSLRTFKECLTRTPLNFWGMVALKEPALAALRSWKEHSEQYDSDRIFLSALSLQGKIAVGREVTLFYRVNPKGACAETAGQAARAREHCRRTTQILLEMAGLPIPGLREEWEKDILALPEDRRRDYLKHSLEGAMTELEAQWGVVSRWSSSSPSWKQWLRKVCPPVLYDFASAVRMRRGVGR